MKLKQILFGVLLSCSMLFSYSGYYAPFSGTKYILQGWKGKTSHGGHNPRYPYALDIVDKVPGTKFDILAVKDGKVTSTGWDNGFGNYIIIKHNDGLYSEYAHLSKVDVKKNQSIQRGKIIGKSGNTGSYAEGVHLHLQFSTNGFPSNMGNTPNSKMVDFVEFSISAVENIDTSYRTHPFISQNFIHEGSKGSIIDGAGSIIKPDKSGYGLNKDIASMHAHDPYNSTVVFQWKNGYSSCSQLDIGTLKENTNGKYIKGDNLGKAIVTVRSWNSAFPNTQKDEIFEVNLDKEPFSIEKASGSSGWTLISITTKNPISNEPKNGHYIYATCSKDNFKYKNRKTLYYDDANKGDNKLVSLTNNYFWAGNGSLISYLKTSYDYKGFGSDKDSAIAYSSHKSINLFQWYVSDKCRKLKIGVQKGWKISDEKISTNGINIKSWASKKWNSNNYCNGKLPCTINVSNKGYYILKVKTNAGVIPTHDSEKRHIMATCVE